MNTSFVYRRLRWLNLPGALLVMLLQRTPVLRVVAEVERAVVASPIAAILRSAFAAAASLGAMHSLAGATEMVTNVPSPLEATVGVAISSVAIGTSGTTTQPDSWTISGSIPPGLAFSGRTTPGTVNVFDNPLTITGTPTVAGNFTVSLRAFEGANGTLTQSPLYTYDIIVTGAVAVAPSITTQPAHQTVAIGGTTAFSVVASGTNLSYQWQRNGANVGGNSATLAIGNAQASDVGVYHVTVTNSSGTASSSRAILGIQLASDVRTGGGASLFQADIKHDNGNTFDQVLLAGQSGAITAGYSPDPAVNKLTRMSYIDINDDIVQIEFAGRGTLSIALDGFSGPATPVNYNQAVNYFKGHATIVVTGADETTNLTIFSVGRATARDPSGQFNFLQSPSETNDPANNQSSLFQGHAATQYDGFGNVALVAIVSANSKFGGLRTSNTNYFATTGATGVYAPGVEFNGPLFIQDIDASGTATPVIQVGSVADARITSGDLSQSNEADVQVSGFSTLKMTAGIDSHGHLFVAKPLGGTLMENGTNVSSRAVFMP